MFEIDNVHALSQLPATDGNFKSVLDRATDDELRQAIDYMERNGGQHKSRITACRRELKRRDKR